MFFAFTYTNFVSSIGMARREDDAKKMERMPQARGQQSMLNPQRKNDGTLEQAYNFNIRSKW
jgi:hypothetical protein